MDVLVLDRGSPDICMEIENYDRYDDGLTAPMSVEETEPTSDIQEI
jgi:hypothetical protein